MCKFLTKISRLENMLLRVGGFLIALILIFIVLTTSYNAIGRKLFETPPSGFEELARYLIPVIVMIGGGICIRKRDHVTAGDIRLILKDKKLSGYVQVVIDIISLVFCCFFAAWCWQRWIYLSGNNTVTAQLHIPMTIVELVMPIGSTLWVLHYILLIARDFNAISKGDYGAIFSGEESMEEE